MHGDPLEAVPVCFGETLLLFRYHEIYSSLSFISSTPIQESVISPRIADPCNWRMIFTSQDLSNKCAHCYQGLLVPWSS